MKLILTGATGAAGLAILRAASRDPSVSHITVLSRRPPPPHAAEFSKSKTEAILHQNFTEYPTTLTEKLKDHDAVIWALGASQNGMDVEAYTKLTHDFPVAAITALTDAGTGSPEKPLRFLYVSGQGADRSGKGWALFSKVKGRTEKDLVDYAATHPSVIAQNIRPGYFFPSDPDDVATTRSKGKAVADKYVFSFLTDHVSSLAITVDDLAKFAVGCVKGEFGTDDLYENGRMRQLLKKQKKSASEL